METNPTMGLGEHPMLASTTLLEEGNHETARTRAEGSYSAEYRDQFRRAYEGYPYLDYARSYTGFRVGSDGLLWVRQFRLPGTSVTTWLAFAPSGSFVAAIDVPRTARLLDVGSEFVLLRVKSDFDVQSVVLYGVVEQKEPEQ